MNNDELRWDCHFIARGGEFGALWETLTGERCRSILMISGAGFDPRASAVFDRLFDVGISLAECRLVEFSTGSGLAPSAQLARAEAHREKLGDLFSGNTLKPIRIDMLSGDGRNIGGVKVSEAFRNPKDYVGFTDVIVDITALPAELYFPLIGTLLTIWHGPQHASHGLGNLHVTVCDNPAVDSMISPEGGDKAETVYGFNGSLNWASIGTPIPIWVPVLGERHYGHLQKIADLVRPEVIAPVLPFPARDPRRADNLLLEYGSLLYESWDVDPTDITYADEQNPFDVYAKLCTLSANYANSLQGIGTAQVSVSTHSSKLHSLGALMAAWEKRLSVVHVKPTRHVVGGEFGAQHQTGELFNVWLAGEAYAQHWG